MLNRSKYRRIPDLYTVGTEVALKDGTVMWLQVLNPFEANEARQDASVARARLVLALREHGSDELTQVRAHYAEDGRETVIENMLSSRADEGFLKVAQTLRADPEWSERLQILERGTELMARPVEDAERKLLLEISEKYSAEVAARVEADVESERERLGALDEAALWEAYREAYLERRGGDVALAEYRLTEMWYAARVCEATRGPDGRYDHDACEGHQVRVFDTKADVRSLPEQLQSLLISNLVDLEISEYDAKNSPRQGSSSASSPLPNGEAASTASTQTETPEPPPGTSSLASATP